MRPVASFYLSSQRLDACDGGGGDDDDDLVSNSSFVLIRPLLFCFLFLLFAFLGFPYPSLWLFLSSLRPF